MSLPVPRVLRCGACDVAVSRALLEWTGGPPPLFDEEGARHVPWQPETTPERGTLWRSDGSLEWGVAGDLLLHADDGIGLAPIGSWIGCCGPCGLDGKNLACPNGHAVATRVADCCTPDFMIVAATEVVITEARGASVFPGEVVALDPGRPIVEASALWVRLHEALGCSAWYGEDVATLLEDRVTATEAPLCVVWRASAASRAAGLPVESVVDAFMAARRRWRARVMLIPG